MKYNIMPWRFPLVYTHTVKRFGSIKVNPINRARVQKLLLAAPALLVLFVLITTWDYFPFVDEVDNLYGAFLISKGFLPYQDFFSGHLPGVPFLFAPLFYLLGPLLSNYHMHFVGRLAVLLLQALANIYLARHFIITFFSGHPKLSAHRQNFIFSILVLLSYLVSPIFMTNLVWSESLLYCYLALSLSFFLQIMDARMSGRSFFVWGVLSGIIILVSLIALPIIFCNIFFLAVLTLIDRRFRTRMYFIDILNFLGTLLISLALFLIFIVCTAGWEELYFQAIGLNLKYVSMTAFGYDGILGVLLSPLQYLLFCCRTFLFPQAAPVIFSETKFDSIFMVMTILSVLVFLFIPQKNRREKIVISLYALGLIYSSLVRHVHFHVGFGFHLAFTITFIGIFCYSFYSPGSPKQKRTALASLCIPALIGMILAYNGLCINIRLLSSREIFTIKGTGQFHEIRKLRSLLKSYNDPQAQKYKVWIPGCLPGDLYYSEMLPAHKYYMFFVRGIEEPYFDKVLKEILENDNILILPKEKYFYFPEKIVKRIQHKIDLQSRHLSD